MGRRDRCVMTEPQNRESEPSSVLADCRDRIDRIDGVLLALLRERMLTAVEAAEAKCALGQPLLAPAREAAVLERLTNLAATPLDPLAVSRIFRAIFDETLNAEERLLPAVRRPAANESA